MALKQERPEAELLAHSDRGVQYASGRTKGVRSRFRDEGVGCGFFRRTWSARDCFLSSMNRAQRK